MQQNADQSGRHKRLSTRLAEYSQTHQHPLNKKIHYLCVPAIFYCSFALLWHIPLLPMFSHWPAINWALAVMLGSLLFYFSLSRAAGVYMGLIMALCWISFELYPAQAVIQLWQICLLVFVIAWLGQFYGHIVEKKRPSFFQDVTFLLIGPLWIVTNVVNHLQQQKSR